MAAHNIEDRVRELVLPLLGDLDVELFDLEYNGGRLVVTIDAPGGLDSGTLYFATKAISREMDEQDPIPSGYTLEVTSPGLERKLRRPVHWQRSIGDAVTIKVDQDFAATHASETRRITGVVKAADDDAATLTLSGASAEQLAPVTELVVPYDVVQKAKTVFDWGPTPKSGGSKKNTGDSKNSKKKEVGAS